METILQNFSRRWKGKNINTKMLDCLNRVYEKNPATGNYVIQVTLDKYTDVFNDWDNSPFNKRDMDPELVIFLENCFDEIPQKEEVDICFCLPEEIKDNKREAALILGVKTYYSSCLNHGTKLLKEKYEKALQYTLTFFSFIAVAILLETIHSNAVVLGTIKQSFNVGVWVFLWKANSMFIYRRREALAQVNKYERFLKAEIYFKYCIDNIRQ